MALSCTAQVHGAQATELECCTHDIERRRTGQRPDMGHTGGGLRVLRSPCGVERGTLDMLIVAASIRSSSGVLPDRRTWPASETPCDSACDIAQIEKGRKLDVHQQPCAGFRLYHADSRRPSSAVNAPRAHQWLRPREAPRTSASVIARTPVCTPTKANRKPAQTLHKFRSTSGLSCHASFSSSR